MDPYFGSFGGQFAAETLMGALTELEKCFQQVIYSSDFQARLNKLLKQMIGRPTPLTFAERLTQHLAGARIYLKREDLNHTGAHKINNALAQALLAKEMGKQRIVAETGAGQHGVATATACAMLGLECTVYMGAVDARRQAPNVQRMQLLGANLHLVESGSQTLKDAVNEAMRDWISNVGTTHYLLGSAVGPHPFPTVVREFQRVIGQEVKAQIQEQAQVLPDMVVACVGGGSNAIGIFADFLDESGVELIGVQAAGEGLETSHHAAPLLVGKEGVFQGARTVVVQDDDGQVLESHSVAPGLDYPAVGPQHAYLKSIGRVRYESIGNGDALQAFLALSRLEGIIPALESSHAVAWAMQTAPKMRTDQIIIVNLSGRGDKDLAAALLEIEKRGLVWPQN